MAKQRDSFKAGLFIIASIAAAIGIVIAIKGIGRFLEPMQHLTVSFKLTDDVGGLAPGDDVRVGGAKVGVVRGMEFIDAKDGAPRRIDVYFTIPRRFAISADADVGIQSTVTGVSVLNFSSFGAGPALATGQSLVGKPSALNELFDAAKEIRSVTLPRVNTAITSANDAIAVYKRTGETATDLIAHLRTKIDPIVERYNTVADNAGSAMQNMSELFGTTKSDFHETVANLKEATEAVKEKLPPMLEKADGLLTHVTKAVDDATVALQDVKQVAANAREVSQTARDVILTNRGKIDGMIASLKATGDNLKNASSEIRHSPWRLLYKPGAGEVANLNLYDSARQFAEGAGQLNDAAAALRDALKDPNVESAKVQNLVEKLDHSFTSFDEVEQQLWKQVKQ